MQTHACAPASMCGPYLPGLRLCTNRLRSPAAFMSCCRLSARPVRHVESRSCLRVHVHATPCRANMHDGIASWWESPRTIAHGAKADKADALIGFKHGTSDKHGH
jgi:hypothetical protein